ncbi:MAG: hypothetical protein QXH80_01580 [Candidatus Nanoarchaeia archaeon]
MIYFYIGLGIVMGISLIFSLIYEGFTPIVIHLTGYAFILAGIGYIIKLVKTRENDTASNVGYLLDKKLKEMTDETRSIRLMMLKLEDRRAQKENEQGLFQSPHGKQ